MGRHAAMPQSRFLIKAASALSRSSLCAYLVLSIGVALGVTVDVSSAQQQRDDDDHHPLHLTGTTNKTKQDSTRGGGDSNNPDIHPWLTVQCTEKVFHILGR